MNTDVFGKIGLTGNEIKVYLRLLELGSIGAGELIKKVGLHRTVVYDTLERLMEKGLVSYVVESNVKQFEANNPVELISYIDRCQSELEDHKTEMTKLLPELEVKRKLSKQEQEATIFRGKKGIKSILEDVLRTGKTMYVYGAEGRLKEIFPIYFHHFHKKRVGKKIGIKIIYKESVKEHKREKELKLIKMKYIPDEFDTPANTWIYGDKVVITVWSEQPISTVIRSKQVAKAYKTNFELLWKLAKN